MRGYVVGGIDLSVSLKNDRPGGSSPGMDLKVGRGALDMGQRLKVGD